MAMSLLRCQQCLHASIWRSLVPKSTGASKLQNMSLQVSRRDYSKCLNWNHLHVPRQQLLLVSSRCSPIQSRQFVLVNNIRRFFQKGPWKLSFGFGFSCMILLMFVDSMYDKYRLSGVSLSDFLSWFRFESPEKSALEKADDVFNTKFANILSKSETPQLKPSRIVSVDRTMSLKFILIFVFS